MNEGWKCPHCGGAHGPHVDSCPVATAPIAAKAGTQLRSCVCGSVMPCGKGGCDHPAVARSGAVAYGDPEGSLSSGSVQTPRIDYP